MSENDPELSRLYRDASAEEPPAVVDAAILAAAWKPVAKPQRSEAPQRRERSLWSRWMAPASAFATLVVALTLAFLVERERPETVGGTADRQTPQRSQRWPPAPATESAKPKADDGAAAEAAAKREAPAAAAPAPPAPTHAPELIAPAPAAVAPAPSAQEAFPAESRAKSAAPGMTAPLRQQAVQRTPEAWLEEISRLKHQGRDNEAAEELAEFRKVYPAHAVPENLLK